MKLFARQRNLYTLYGALFGALFPLLATVLVTFIPRGIEYLYWIIFTAPVFLGVFARFAGIRQDNINEINRGLEQTVQDRTAAIQAMLDVTGQALLTVDQDLRVGEEFSAPCVAMFGESPAGRRIGALMYPDGEGRDDFERGLGMVLSGNAKPDVIFDLLDERIELKGKRYEVEYRLVAADRVMISLADITLEEKIAERDREDEYRRTLIYHVASRLDHFSSLLRQASDLFERLDLSTVSSELLELLHTFKANSSFFGFVRTSEAAHDAETAIADAQALGDDPRLDQWADHIRETYYTELEIVRETLGDAILGDADSVRIPKPYYHKILSYIRKKYPKDATLANSVAHFQKRPFRDFLVRLSDVSMNLARRQGKKVQPLSVQGGEFLVQPEPYGEVAETFAHIVRNMVTHGIELPLERRRLGKPEEGGLAVKVEQEDHRILVEFSDDGRGISPLKLKSMAMDAGVLSSMDEIRDEAALALVFHPGLTTALQADSDAGRGMGLSAVKRSVEKLGGSVSVSSALDKGTTLRVYLPRVR